MHMHTDQGALTFRSSYFFSVCFSKLYDLFTRINTAFSGQVYYSEAPQTGMTEDVKGMET